MALLAKQANFLFLTFLPMRFKAQVVLAASFLLLLALFNPKSRFFFLSAFHKVLSSTGILNAELVVESNSVSFSDITAPSVVNENPYIFAQSLPLSGLSARVGREYARGIDLALREINDSGGLHNRKIMIWRKDDQYEPKLTIANTHKFRTNTKVISLLGYWGTPTTKASLNMLEGSNLMHIAPLTGASIFRNQENDRFLHFRSSYDQEALIITEYLKQNGFLRPLIVYQDDSFGFDFLNSFEKYFQKFGLQPVGKLPITRNSSDLGSTIVKSYNSKPDAVIIVSVGTGVTDIINGLDHMGLHPQFFTISFAGIDTLFDKLPRHLSYGIGASQVVDFPWDTRIKYVHDYQKRIYLDDPSKGFSYLSLEGYSVMKWLYNIMKDLDPDFTRDQFNNKIKSFIANNPERNEMPKPNIVFLGSSPWMPGIN